MPFTLPLGAQAIDFSLPSTEDTIVSLQDFQDAKGIVLFFTCNHCPYVIHSDEITRQCAEKFQKQNIVFVAINSNSQNTYAEDSFPKMKERMALFHFPWLYLYDESQKVAKAYGALRTPHFFLFDQQKKLIYCGAAVDSPRDPSRITHYYLENALTEYLQNKPISLPLTNPIGCNVKWEGKEKHWMPDDACDLI